VAFVASRTSLADAGARRARLRFAVEAVTVVRWFVTFVALPALLAAAIARALAATLRIGGKDLTIVRPGSRSMWPLASIDRVSVWRLPFPSAGLTVRLASGRCLPQTIGATDPMPVLQALSHHGVAGEGVAEHPVTVYAHARAEQGSLAVDASRWRASLSSRSCRRRRSSTCISTSRTAGSSASTTCWARARISRLRRSTGRP
jgi:hypothetical protein